MLPVAVRRERRKRKKAEQEQLKFRKFHVRRGDKVLILAGKDKGKEGKVLAVLTKKGRVLVEKVNIVKRHQKPNARMQKGGIIEKEGPIHVSNVKVIDAAGDEA